MSLGQPPDVILPQKFSEDSEELLPFKVKTRRRRMRWSLLLVAFPKALGLGASGDAECTSNNWVTTVSGDIKSYKTCVQKGMT